MSRSKRQQHGTTRRGRKNHGGMLWWGDAEARKRNDPKLDIDFQTRKAEEDLREGEELGGVLISRREKDRGRGAFIEN